jgi:peptidoglycan/LPS O-acetylase OafA/YrhL
MKVSAGAQTNLLSDLDDTRDLAMGTAHGNMEQAGDEIIAIAPCPACGKRDPLALRSFRGQATPWLAGGGVFLGLGLIGGAYLLVKGQDLGLYLMSPLMILGLVILLVGAFKRFKAPPSGVFFHSVDPRPWAHLGP